MSKIMKSYYHQPGKAVGRFFPGALLLVLSLSVTGLWAEEAAQAVNPADDEAQLAAIRHLGDLNGVALHCKALLETQRMKRALVATLPKRRVLGEIFDEQSHKSYMKFIEDKSHCPSPADLIEEISLGIAELEKVWGKAAPASGVGQ